MVEAFLFLEYGDVYILSLSATVIPQPKAFVKNPFSKVPHHPRFAAVCGTNENPNSVTNTLYGLWFYVAGERENKKKGEKNELYQMRKWSWGVRM